MPVINADYIRNLITTNGELFVPDRIIKAVSETIVSNAEDIWDERQRLINLYKEHMKDDGPTLVNYSTDITIDAYVIHYLPRNTLIPKLLFLSLAYHPAFQTIRDEVNILDLGSGTGGVVLGLLDLFNDKLFSSIKANITSCEISDLALRRQKELITHTKYHCGTIQHFCADLADAQTYDNILSKLAPYDYIIAANLLAELHPDDIELLLSKLPAIVAPNAVLLFADPPRAYVDKLKRSISDILHNLGFYQYYPCPPGYKCQKSKCQWVWLDFDFTCPDIEINGDSLETHKQLSTAWSIFCRSNHSIYDVLQQVDSSLTWGVAVPIGKEFSLQEKLNYTLCTAGGIRKLTHTRKDIISLRKTEVIWRGSILGFNDDVSKVCVWHPLYGLEQ